MDDTPPPPTYTTYSSPTPQFKVLRTHFVEVHATRASNCLPSSNNSLWGLITLGFQLSVKLGSELAIRLVRIGALSSPLACGALNTSPTSQLGQAPLHYYYPSLQQILHNKNNKYRQALSNLTSRARSVCCLWGGAPTQQAQSA